MICFRKSLNFELARSQEFLSPELISTKRYLPLLRVRRCRPAFGLDFVFLPDFAADFASDLLTFGASFGVAGIAAVGVGSAGFGGIASFV